MIYLHFCVGSVYKLRVFTEDNGKYQWHHRLFNTFDCDPTHTFCHVIVNDDNSSWRLSIISFSPKIYLDASTEEGTKPWLYPCSNSISVHFLSCERAFNILKCVNESLCYREASLSFLDTLAVKQRPPLLVHSQEKCPSNKAFFCQISSCPAIRLSCCCCCCMWPLKLAALHRTAPHITIVYWGFEKEKEKIRVRF